MIMNLMVSRIGGIPLHRSVTDDGYFVLSPLKMNSWELLPAFWFIVPQV